MKNKPSERIELQEEREDWGGGVLVRIHSRKPSLHKYPISTSSKSNVCETSPLVITSCINPLGDLSGRWGTGCWRCGSGAVLAVEPRTSFAVGDSYPEGCSWWTARNQFKRCSMHYQVVLHVYRVFCTLVLLHVLHLNKPHPKNSWRGLRQMSRCNLPSEID